MNRSATEDLKDLKALVKQAADPPVVKKPVKVKKPVVKKPVKVEKPVVSKGSKGPIGDKGDTNLSGLGLKGYYTEDANPFIEHKNKPLSAKRQVGKDVSERVSEMTGIPSSWLNTFGETVGNKRYDFPGDTGGIKWSLGQHGSKYMAPPGFMGLVGRLTF